MVYIIDCGTLVWYQFHPEVSGNNGKNIITDCAMVCLG